MKITILLLALLSLNTAQAFGCEEQCCHFKLYGETKYNGNRVKSRYVSNQPSLEACVDIANGWLGQFHDFGTVREGRKNGARLTSRIFTKVTKIEVSYRECKEEEPETITLLIEPAPQESEGLMSGWAWW